MTETSTDGRTFVSPAGRVVRTEIWGVPVYFTITNPKDVIQKSHLSGAFYEPEELEIIRQFCPPGAVFCDIGANIGNHSLFALKFLRVSKAILFEPNPRAIEILRSNLELNGVIDLCDLSHIGIGLSDFSGSGLSIEAPRRNLGAGRLVEGEGDLKVMPGDAALAGQTIDFIKIDVEGMEMRVLAGLSETISKSRPRIFIEVDRANRTDFTSWVRENDYSVRAKFKRYRVNENFLLVANPKAAPTESVEP